MPFGAKIKISNAVTVVVEVAGGQFPDEAQKAVIEACSFWQAVPETCPMPGCGAALIFTARHPQSYHYYGLRCLGPNPHEMNFGERKDHSSLYFKDDGWKDAHTGGDQGGNEPAAAQATQTQTTQPATASPTGDKASAQTIRMCQAIAKAKKPEPNIDGIAEQIFGKKLVDCSEEDAKSVIEYLKLL